MLLPGRIEASTLGDLLGLLHRESTTGRLELSELAGRRGRGVPGRKHRIHLISGLVAAVDTELPVPPLGEILWREGLVGAPAIRNLVARIEAGDRRSAGEILVAEGLCDGNAVRAALRVQLRARVEVLFSIDDATLSFHTARPVPFVWRIPPLAPGDFLHGRPRARDRRRAVGASREGSARASGETEPPRSGTRPTRREDARERAYRLLGLTAEAGSDDVRRAFRRLAGELHPDRAPEAERGNRMARFAQLSAAYHLLVA